MDLPLAVLLVLLLFGVAPLFGVASQPHAGRGRQLPLSTRAAGASRGRFRDPHTSVALVFRPATMSIAGCKQGAALTSARASVVELRFFGGLTVDETAEVLIVSPETIMRDWDSQSGGCCASSRGSPDVVVLQHVRSEDGIFERERRRTRVRCWPREKPTVQRDFDAIY